MIKNYLKTALRNLWRFKSYALINIIGLGIGIAAMVWGYQNYRFSFSFDKFHPDIDKSRGTRDMIAVAEKLGIKVKRFK